MNKTVTIVADVRARAAAYDGEDKALLLDFVDACFDGVLDGALAARSPAALFAAVCDEFELIREPRTRGHARATVQPLDGSEGRCDMALISIADDMPFLVDTVGMAVRDTGAQIDWMMHPVVRVSRDGDGRVKAIRSASETTDHGDEESLIRLEFAAAAGTDGEALIARVESNLQDLARVVSDWQPMRRQLQRVVSDLDTVPTGVSADECAETQAFLRWLADDHFTLLGYRCRQVTEGEDGEEIMVDSPGTSLGLLREDRPDIDPDGYVAPAASMDKYTQSSRVLVVTKANMKAWIHHAETMDVIAIKRLDDIGNVIGAHRFLGLFSGEAYAMSPRQIPLLRQKVRDVMSRSALRPRSHTAKSLRYILETFPRDELFQSSEDELYTVVMGVLGMRETERLRLFLRRDRYDRFYSCLVYMPRERYTLELRDQIQGELERRLDGRTHEFDAQFLRSDLVRVYYQIVVEASSELTRDTATLEAELIAATRAWPDRFAKAADAAGTLMPAYARAFDIGYRERFDGAEAVADAQLLATLEDDAPPVLRVIGVVGDNVRLKLYGSGAEMPLSTVLPILENFGLSVHTQWPYEIQRGGHAPQWIHEFEAEHPQAAVLDASASASPGQDVAVAEAIAEAFADIVSARAEDDSLNRLIITAGFSPRQVVLVRTITRYLVQTDLPYSPAYVEAQLTAHADLVAQLVALFERRFNPANANADGAGVEDMSLQGDIDAALDAVASLDADRILRAFHGVVTAALRTNYFQHVTQAADTADDTPRFKSYVSIKLDPTRMPELPRPLPMFEAFVYAPEVEGVHLRGGRVARGGLRWSDRREDFRTEVLGLMKAQMVKNAVIVPVGAKGGFVVKNAPADESREARQARGIACYKTFIRGLLDITDNRVGETIEHPPEVVRFDEDDPYLVVAADKGTATFSDIANGISQEYGFWLDDAFASGGSAGYDHKIMGITARGAWEGVKRHFREIGRDIQSEPFTVVGIGDMAGDVFGNGMLLSEHIQLLAAFNHMHIFIDPNPDPAVSFAERKRLFELPRSSWTDYDESLISAGGGLYERSAKIIDLSDAARAALGIEARRLAPAALIHQILRAPVDLLWNGGIGTYVKARAESHAQVGDRANDGLRVDGRDLRCKVVGEGGNLGLTQAGRVEYALAGGRINTDAIDNSGGVDSSDLEVNIKIALGTVEVAGALTREDRNALLEQMTPEVIELVLATNYLQTQQISLMESDAVARLEEQVSFIRSLERDGWLDRRLERLPDDEAVEERLRSRQGLTRPELAVLISYMKIALADSVLTGTLPDDPYLEGVLEAGFPSALSARFPDAVAGHRLKRELITTLLTNQMVDRLGITTAHRLPAGFGARMDAAVRAYVLADTWLGGEALFSEIDALDNVISSEAQYDLHKIVTALLKHAMSWLLGTPTIDGDLATLVARYQDSARRLLAELPSYLAGAYAERWQAEKQRWVAAGLDETLADRIACADAGGGIMDIVCLAEAHDRDVFEVAGIYFALGTELGVVWLQDAIHGLPADGRWAALARASLRGDSYRIHEQIVAQVLDVPGDDPLAEWRAAHERTLAFIGARMDELRGIEQPGHEHLTVAVRDMSRLATARPTTLGGAA
ncbi:NAD-glutamate dehydrogenase [Salinisphaera aquimarina]|uniref:NAD-glutamate dehydrogenase n=1 Tax=Salinisphaera aquimarina TaxID=2094031 RepID=A0ABV7EU08_9GAMM